MSPSLLHLTPPETREAELRPGDWGAVSQCWTRAGLMMTTSDTTDTAPHHSSSRHHHRPVTSSGAQVPAPVLTSSHAPVTRPVPSPAPRSSDSLTRRLTPGHGLSHAPVIDKLHQLDLGNYTDDDCSVTMFVSGGVVGGRMVTSDHKPAAADSAQLQVTSGDILIYQRPIQSVQRHMCSVSSQPFLISYS